MAVTGGYPFYGQDIGILVFGGVSPRIPGDPGHAASFAYPVRYRVIKGGFAALVDGSDEMLQTVCCAAAALKEEGARGVVGDCGLMSLYQQQVARTAGIPFVGSSLCLVPTVWQLVGQCGTIGILTGHSQLLKPAHLAASGITPNIPLCIQGLEDEPHFARVVIEGGAPLDPAAMLQDVLNAGEKLRQRCSTLSAVIVECSNLPTYSAALAAALGLPVFDILTAANLLAGALCPPTFGL